jgi:hypothetical protein
MSNDLLDVVQGLEIAPVGFCLDSATVMTATMNKYNAAMREQNAEEAEHVVCVNHGINLVAKSMNRDSTMRDFREILKKIISIFGGNMRFIQYAQRLGHGKTTPPNHRRDPMDEYGESHRGFSCSIFASTIIHRREP